MPPHHRTRVGATELRLYAVLASKNRQTLDLARRPGVWARMSWRRILVLGVSTLLTGLLGFYVVQRLEMTKLVEYLSLERAGVAALALPLYGLALLLRGVRVAMSYRWLGHNEASTYEGFQIATLLALANHVVPFKVGEASFVILSKRLFQTPVATGAGLLVVHRLYDAAALMFIASAGLGASLDSGLWFACAGAIALGAWNTHGVLRRVVPNRAWAAKLRDGLAIIGPPRQRALLLLSSLAIWLSFAALFAAALWGLGHRLELDRVLVASAISNVAGFIPASALGSFGPMEAGWTAAFHWAGMSESDAAATGLVVHILLVAFSALASAVFIAQLWPRLAAIRRRAS